MSICLVNPPQLQLREPTAYIPLGLAYVAAVNPQDTMVVNWADGAREEELPEADTYGITCQRATLKSAAEVIQLIRRMRPDAHILAGGALPTVNPKAILEVGASEVFQGLYADIRRYQPDRSKFKLEHVVNRTGIHGSLKPSTHVISSYGCPFSCNFCEKGHEAYRKFIYREPAHVMEELDSLQREYGIEHVRFCDDCFTANKKHGLDLCKALANSPITYKCITRTDCVDDELIGALAQSGCIEIDFGIESGSQKILDLMNKKLTVEQNLVAISLAKKHGIKVKTFFQIGYPGETEEDRELTLEFAKQAQPDLWILSRWTTSDFFYPDDDPSWVSFRERLKQCIDIL